MSDRHPTLNLSQTRLLILPMKPPLPQVFPVFLNGSYIGNYILVAQARCLMEPLTSLFSWLTHNLSANSIPSSVIIWPESDYFSPCLLLARGPKSPSFLTQMAKIRLLSGLPISLQSRLHPASGVILVATKWSQGTPLLNTLQWPRMEFKNKARILVMAYKALCHLALCYFSHLISYDWSVLAHFSSWNMPAYDLFGDLYLLVLLPPLLSPILIQLVSSPFSGFSPPPPP